MLNKGDNKMDIKQILKKHQEWLQDSSKGQRADLSGADLSGADLSRANLSEADLSRANLYGANLSKANLSEANLSGADLSRANLYGANLSEANLYGANLSKANLSGANLSGAILPQFQLVTQGTMKVYKKASEKVVELIIPPNAERTASLVGRKCRCEFAYVKRILNLDGTECKNRTEVLGTYDKKTKYVKGQKVVPDKYNDDIRVECTHGIHFFITFEEAANY